MPPYMTPPRMPGGGPRPPFGMMPPGGPMMMGQSTPNMMAGPGVQSTNMMQTPASVPPSKYAKENFFKGKFANLGLLREMKFLENN